MIRSHASHRLSPESRWQVFLSAPHRLLFFAGAAQLLLVMAWWLITLLGRTGAIAPIPPATPPTWTHAFLTLYGVFPLFVFGFMLTVYPRWMSQQPVPANRYVPLFLLLVGGLLIHYVGIFTTRAIAVTGVLVFVGGWLYGLHLLLGIYRAALQKGPYERALNLALGAGAGGVALYGYALATDSVSAYIAARGTGLWLFLGVMLFTICHRMIPFFARMALREETVPSPAWSLPTATALLAAHALLEGTGQTTYLFLADLPLATIVLHHLRHWNLRRALAVRLLGMLHIAFAWLGVAMLLYAALSLAHCFGVAGFNERAPLHAYTVAFVIALVVAMVSRITLAHAGYPMQADCLTWLCFLGVNGVAMLRIAAEFAPAGAWLTINIAAAGAWIAVLLPWFGRYAPLYLRPRADGGPG
jgi:uncharacterized protein involved in response to NO